ncbi:MAG: hypothetical protein WBR10_16655 [Candidatus Acidiferrum sp.]
MNDIEPLALRCYGYGKWKAPYWFIGPEQGQDPSENNDLNLRNEAFCKLGKDGLSDCRAFHCEINQRTWHEGRPPLQRTWRRLMLLLMTFLEKTADDKEVLRAYQRDRWGSSTGETCVIELSGLPARSSKVSRDRESFRPGRIKFIREKMRACKPVFVVMYGMSEKKHWEEIAECALRKNYVQKVGSTIIALAPHPVAFGTKDQDWRKLGLRLRLKCGR